MTTETPIEIARRVWPEVEWRADGEYVNGEAPGCEWRVYVGGEHPPQWLKYGDGEWFVVGSIEDAFAQCRLEYQRRTLAAIAASGLPSHEDAYKDGATSVAMECLFEEKGKASVSWSDEWEDSATREAIAAAQETK